MTSCDPGARTGPARLDRGAPSRRGPAGVSVRPRRFLGRRLCLDAGGQLARGAARSESAASDIRALLEAENAYADAVLAPTLGLQKELKREMRARLKEDDSEPPQVDGPWAYYSRFRPGGQRRIDCRKPRESGAETVLIDGDACAEERLFFISLARVIRPIIRSSPGAPTTSVPRC